MGNYTLYRITFKTQLHLGRTAGPAQKVREREQSQRQLDADSAPTRMSSLGLENTETYVPADTLFSAICQTWATFYGTESLTDFLSKYNEDGTVLPFTLTSAFPFAQDVYHFPKPLTFRGSEDTSEKGKKEIKRVQFVSDNIFRSIIAGNTSDFADAPFINGEKVWISCEEEARQKAAVSKRLNVAEEKLKDDDLIIWKPDTRARVTIGSQNAGSQIWHVETVQFNTDCGLWFAAEFDSDETREKIETLLRVLGDNGIGGERNAGYGMFKFSNENTIDLPTAEAGNPFVTLSPICPKSHEQLSVLLNGDVAYAINPLTGWVSTTGSASRRKQVNMFTEGSVLNAGEEQRIGSLVDLSPNGYAHPVYRYGYAWQVGIKGTSE